jgi:hypothetical protein
MEMTGGMFVCNDRDRPTEDMPSFRRLLGECCNGYAKNHHDARCPVYIRGGTASTHDYLSVALCLKDQL